MPTCNCKKDLLLEVGVKMLFLVFILYLFIYLLNLMENLHCVLYKVIIMDDDAML